MLYSTVHAKTMHFIIARTKMHFVITCITCLIIEATRMQFSVAFIKMHTNIIDFSPSVH